MKRDMDLIRELMLKFESFPMEPGDNVHITPDNPGVRLTATASTRLTTTCP